MELRVAEQAHLSDTGRQREHNEDSFFVRPPAFGVADGMGGAQAGEVASRTAAETFESTERGDAAPEAYLRSIAESANARIHQLASEDSARSGMGTTFTAAVVEGEEIALGHVGDSRAYVFRDGELRQLTADHSLVEELRRQGRLTDEQAEEHPQRSIITRALGPEAEVKVDTMTYKARPGDVYLLCSDGLTGMVTDERIAEVLAESPSLERAATELVREANEAGGRDNITVVAFRLEAAGDEADTEAATLVGPSAAEAGLTTENLQAEAARRRARDRSTVESARPSREPSRRRSAAKVLIPLLIVIAVAAGAFLGIRQFYFLGANEDERLTLYRGLPYDLPLGVELYSEVDVTSTNVADLPADRYDEATDHELRGRDDAESLLASLEDAAAAATEPPPAEEEPKSEDEPKLDSDGGGGRTGGGGQGGDVGQ